MENGAEGNPGRGKRKGARGVALAELPSVEGGSEWAGDHTGKNGRFQCDGDSGGAGECADSGVVRANVGSLDRDRGKRDRGDRDGWVVAVGEAKRVSRIQCCPIKSRIDSTGCRVRHL